MYEIGSQALASVSKRSQSQRMVYKGFNAVEIVRSTDHGSLNVYDCVFLIASHSHRRRHQTCLQEVSCFSYPRTPGAIVDSRFVKLSSYYLLAHPHLTPQS